MADPFPFPQTPPSSPTCSSRLSAACADLQILPCADDLAPLASSIISLRPSTAPADPRQRFLSSAASLPSLDGEADAPAALLVGRNPKSTCVAATGSSQPAPFLVKTYDLVDDKDTNGVISWNASGNSFIVWRSQALCQCLLPRYFRHANFASFIRQLNIYGFRKIDPERWEFANLNFLRGERHLLACIHRRKPTNLVALHHYHHHQPQYTGASSSPCMLTSDLETSLEVEKLGIRAELSGLKHEVCRMGERLQHSEEILKVMRQRLQMSKRCEQHMLTFMGKTMRDSSFLPQRVGQPLSGTVEMLKRQRLTGALPSFAESDSRIVNMDGASGTCDAPISDQQGTSSGSWISMVESAERSLMEDGICAAQSISCRMRDLSEIDDGSRNIFY